VDVSLHVYFSIQIGQVELYRRQVDWFVGGGIVGNLQALFVTLFPDSVHAFINFYLIFSLSFFLCLFYLPVSYCTCFVSSRGPLSISSRPCTKKIVIFICPVYLSLCLISIYVFLYHLCTNDSYSFS
jgi:hypothetical protein